MNANIRLWATLIAPLCLVVSPFLAGRHASAQDDLAIVYQVPKQPLIAATTRLVEALAFAGSPLSQQTIDAIDAASKLDRPADVSKAIQSALDPLCLAAVHINAESRVKIAEGPVAKKLMQNGWRAFLVKVHNEAGITPELVADSPNAAPVYQQGRGARQKPRSDEDLVDPNQTQDRWLDLSMLHREPLKKQLSGLNLEYRIVMLGSRDAGKREANIAFHVGQGTQDIGFRNSVAILFDCQSAVDVKLKITDVDGRPTTASLLITDDLGRVYPNPAKRLAPDFFFHHQVYRADGESVLLPPGVYNVTITRGPEYVPIRRSMEIPDQSSHSESFQLKRWIHMAGRRWYSGDHHVHAAGCAHYDSPTEGVGPEDMMRHLLGEDVNVGCVLSWGPCWYTQKEFFNGQTSALSTKDNLMRYDVEVSGFPSSHAGHLCLLNLTEDDYPGTKTLEEWPSWTLPVLQWGQQQGGVVGYSHSGWGLALPDIMPDGSRKFVGRPWGGASGDWRGKAANSLPDYEMPKFDGIGANEFVVTVAEDACDFISAVDTPAIWELNIWYHTLNCGMTARISGETDFPCIYGDRVGLGRIYVQLDDDQPLGYANWVAGLKAGRSYCGDGLSHVIDFSVNGLGVGKPASPEHAPSQLDIAEPATVDVTFDVAALLSEATSEATERIRNLRLDEKPYWHLERSRLGDSRNVPVEVIVNGEVVATRQILADGSTTSHSIPVPIEKSSWIAIRILPSVHTNPIFIHVADQPIRANARSAQWCIDAVETCWNSKQGQIRPSDQAAAKAAYDRAKNRYQTILAESLP